MPVTAFFLLTPDLDLGNREWVYTYSTFPGIKIVGIGNDSTALANKTTKNSPFVGNSDIYVLYIATVFETIIFSASIPLPVYSSQTFHQTLESMGNLGNSA